MFLIFNFPDLVAPRSPASAASPPFQGFVRPDFTSSLISSPYGRVYYVSVSKAPEFCIQLLSSLSYRVSTDTYA